MAQNTKTTILFKTDKKVKAAAQRNLKRQGLPLSTYLNMQLRKAAQPGAEIELVPSPKLARWIREARKEYAEGKAHGPFNSYEEMVADLRRD